MKLPQIRLESQFAQIQMNTTPATQTIEQPQADLDIQQPKAELHIETTPSKFTVDQSQAWADMDLKPILKRIEEFAKNGYQDWLNGIARRAHEGNTMMRIENGGNVLATIAKNNSESTTYEFNIGFIPSLFSVKTFIEPSKLDIQWDIKKVINNTKIRKPIIEYNPGQIDIGIKQYEDLKINFSNLKLVGTNYEQEI
jgi:hypothetical protein